jgi:hypothetical protein
MNEQPPVLKVSNPVLWDPKDRVIVEKLLNNREWDAQSIVSRNSYR